MLVLGRKKGEAILIGGDIEISVLEITSDGVKIGISAPKEVGILRKELFISVADSNRDALQPNLSITDLKKQFQGLKNL
ncbi:carbon storage regulator CsrA [Paenibacillus beijingensis]|uniref:Translational regulator CsrA n=1 Tax=Paenibacillus beijingensis TaxID=1126833 RepID=A0A0D5NHW0_9BACL|nr:carbon storage regulator CsrA [Paenibacillus beijingensis]AJY74513.1 hypothetical protein VN24_07915 [Paenibacillus beijingensis]